MSDDLNISDNPDEEPEADVILEFTSREDYISSCFNVLASIQTIEIEALPDAGQKRVKTMRKRCLAILDACVKEMFSEFFDKEEEDEEDDKKK